LTFATTEKGFVTPKELKIDGKFCKMYGKKAMLAAANGDVIFA
jgi:hypothetical protein